MTYEDKLKKVRVIGFWASLAALHAVVPVSECDGCVNCMLIASHNITTISYVQRCATMVVLAQ